METFINLIYLLFGIIIGLLIAIVIEHKFWSLNLFYEWLKEKFKTK